MDQMFAEHIFHDNAIFGVLMGLGIAGMVVYILLSALFEEAREQGKRWRSAHGPLTDSHQSPGVRACAERLASKRRSARIEAARLMCDLNDTSAVPALLRAMDLHWKDADFLEVAVRSLAVL